MTTVIDIHGHAGAPAVDKLVAGRPEHAAVLRAMAESAGPESMRFNQETMLPHAGAKFASLEARLRDLDAFGISRQIVSPSPHLYNYWADAALGEQIVGLANEAVVSLVAQAPDRLAGLGIVAMQHPELAVNQLRGALQAGLKGVEISASVGERELSDPGFEVFWREAAAMRAVIFIHPLGSSLGRRLNRFYLSNVVGQPIETTIALSHMIFSGVFDRHPELRVVAAHAGGYLPHYIGRSDHAWRVRPEAASCAKPPSEYLSRIWYDTVLFGDTDLNHMIAKVGDERLLFGSDYPFDMADCDATRLASALPAGSRAKVMATNAVELFGLAGASP